MKFTPQKIEIPFNSTVSKQYKMLMEHMIYLKSLLSILNMHLHVWTINHKFTGLNDLKFIY